MRGPVLLGAAAVVAAAAVAAAASLAPRDPGADPPSPMGTASRAPAVPTSPLVLGGCWVPSPSGDVTLTTAQAETLTTKAAGALRRGQAPAQFAATVATVLSRPEPDALVVARSLLVAPQTARLACSVTRVDVRPEKPGRSGLTPRAQRLRRAWTKVFAGLPAGGFARGGVRSGHVDNSPHYEGRAIDVFFRTVNSSAQRRLGWAFAQWVVAHAERHQVLSVIYSDHIWTSWASSAGFRGYEHPSGPTRNPVLRHLDHVHVAVESGRPYRP